MQELDNCCSHEHTAAVATWAQKEVRELTSRKIIRDHQDGEVDRLSKKGVSLMIYIIHLYKLVNKKFKHLG